MLDIITPNGYKAVSDGEAITITDSSQKVLLSYHPMQGEVIFGPPSVHKVIRLREDLEYVRGILARTDLQQE